MIAPSKLILHSQLREMWILIKFSLRLIFNWSFSDGIIENCVKNYLRGKRTPVRAILKFLSQIEDKKLTKM